MSKAADGEKCPKRGLMSSRQQLLYLLNMTQPGNEVEEEEEEEEPELQFKWIDYINRQKEKIRSQIPKSIVNKRIKYHRLSHKEYTQIKKNIYIERKKAPFSEDDAYICKCEKPKKSIHKPGWFENVNE